MQKQNNTAKAGNNTAKDGKQKNQPKQKKQAPKAAQPKAQLCFSCAQPGHVRANCPVNNAFVSRAQVKAIQTAARENLAAKPMFKAKAAAVASSRFSGLGGWSVLHEGMPHPGHPERVGRLEAQQNGDGSQTFRGCERLGAIGLTGTAMPQGSMLTVGFPNGFQMNPLAFGVKLPLEAKENAKFRFTKLKYSYVPTISNSNANANGGFIIGFNEDPTQPMPQVSSQGVDAVASWEPNMQPGGVFEKVTLNARLCQDQQDPLFVDTNGDQRFSSQGVLGVWAATDFAAVTQSFGMLFVSYEVVLSEPNIPIDIPPIVYGSGAAVASGQTGDLAVTQLTTWWGDQAAVTIVPFSAYGGQFMIAGGATPNSSNYGWVVVYNALANTAAATFTAVPTLSMVTAGALTNWAAAPWTGTLPGPNTRASGIVANNIFGGNTQSTNAVYSSVFTFSAGKPAVINLAHATVSSGTMTVNIMMFRVQLSTSSRLTPNLFLTDGEQSLSVAQFVDMQRMGAEVADIDTQLCAMYEKVATSVNDCQETLSPVDANCLNMCLASVGSDERVTITGAQPAFVGGLLASAASFLLKRFGPKVAAHLLHMGVSRLEKYAAEH